MGSAAPEWRDAMIKSASCSNARSSGVRRHLIKSAAFDNSPANAAAPGRYGVYDVEGSISGRLSFRKDSDCFWEVISTQRCHRKTTQLTQLTLALT